MANKLSSDSNSVSHSLPVDVVWVDDRELPEDGPLIVPVPFGAAEDVAKRYRSGRSTIRCTDGPVVAIVRIDKLNSPDELRVVQAARSGTQIALRIELRRFTGLLGANLVRTALIEAHLNLLVPGEYNIELVIDILTFAEWGRSESAQLSATDSLSHAFKIVP